MSPRPSARCESCGAFTDQFGVCANCHPPVPYESHKYRQVDPASPYKFDTARLKEDFLAGSDLSLAAFARRIAKEGNYIREVTLRGYAKDGDWLKAKSKLASALPSLRVERICKELDDGKLEWSEYRLDVVRHLIVTLSEMTRDPDLGSPKKVEAAIKLQYLMDKVKALEPGDDEVSDKPLATDEDAFEALRWANIHLGLNDTNIEKALNLLPPAE